MIPAWADETLKSKFDCLYVFHAGFQCANLSAGIPEIWHAGHGVLDGTVLVLEVNRSQPTNEVSLPNGLDGLAQPHKILEDYSLSDDNIEKLEKRILDLIGICEKISKDNDLLKGDHKKLREEFLDLREKNKMAREKIEAILQKLEATES